MKTLTIEEVANGWMVHESGPDATPGVYRLDTTHVYETVAGLQGALPALLGKETAAAPSPPDVRPPVAEREEDAPDPTASPKRKPACHKCGMTHFVVKHPTQLGHWFCDRGTCKLDFVP